MVGFEVEKSNRSKKAKTMELKNLPIDTIGQTIKVQIDNGVSGQPRQSVLIEAPILSSDVLPDIEADQLRVAKDIAIRTLEAAIILLQE